MGFKNVTTVVMTAGLATLMSTAAFGASVVPGTIRNGSTVLNFCLNSDLNTRNQNGGIVHIWECADSSFSSSIWSFHSGGQIRNSAGLCLDSDVNTMHQSGGIVHVWECNDTPQQTWKRATNRRIDQYGESGTVIRNSAGLCLDSDVNTMHQSGGIVHVWECNDTLQQTWFFTPILD
ncbi:MAG: ricin-type beta-trefoil lectin domain protein [Cyanobacteria bacterium J06650_10]